MLAYDIYFGYVIGTRVNRMGGYSKIE